MNLIDIRSTWNHLKKNRVHTLLNVSGLALGLLFFLQLVTYIAYEKGYDKYFKSGDRIFRINYDITQEGEVVLHSAKTPRRLFRVLKDEIPEIEKSAMTYYEAVLVKYEDRLFSEQRDLWVQGDFTDIFQLEMIRGEAKLNDAWNCIISESKAGEIFGDEDTIGKVIWDIEAMRHTITGIFKELHANCHINCDYFMPIRTWVESGGIPNEENFLGASWWTYIKIAEGADPGKVEKDLEQVSKKYLTHLENQNRIGKFSLQQVNERTDFSAALIFDSAPLFGAELINMDRQFIHAGTADHRVDLFGFDAEVADRTVADIRAAARQTVFIVAELFEVAAPRLSPESFGNPARCKRFDRLNLLACGPQFVHLFLCLRPPLRDGFVVVIIVPAHSFPVI